jgi:hypothetical protein
MLAVTLGQHGDGGEQTDLLGHGGQTGHQGEGFQAVVPVAGFSTKTLVFHHRENEVQTLTLGFQSNLLVVLEGGFISRVKQTLGISIVLIANSPCDGVRCCCEHNASIGLAAILVPPHGSGSQRCGPFSFRPQPDGRRCRALCAD